jgi:predicted dehydrogenase
MKFAVVGYGIQGRKRVITGGDEIVCIVDPVKPEAQFKNIEQVDLSTFDAALVCTSEEPKLSLLDYLIRNRKHVLVEKPLMAGSSTQLMAIKELAEQNKVACYTAYNHRFEPGIQKIKSYLDSGALGQIYAVKLFYGNGTARDVRNSVWRDQGDGVLHDLGSHLLDLLALFLKDPPKEFVPYQARCFENKAYDYVHFGSRDSQISCDLEVTLLSWKNSFKIDIFAEKGTLHLDGLCKWGASSVHFRQRILPSGKPLMESYIYEKPDATWALEFETFKKMCREGSNNLSKDIWINNVIADVGQKSQKLNDKVNVL